MTTQWKQFRSFSGPVIQGTTPYELTSTDSHVERAFWLTTKVETGGKFGAIMAADGTALTAGLDQHIAVYPKELAGEDGNAADDQGSLWRLLRRMMSVRLGIDAPSMEYAKRLEVLLAYIDGQNWVVAEDGVLRYTKAKEYRRTHFTHQVDVGDVVYGAEIRDVLTPPGGVVPSKGVDWDAASGWAEAFHNVFEHPAGFSAQIAFGKEHLVQRSKARRVWVVGRNEYKGSVEDFAYPGEISTLRVGDRLAPELDLALCMYQCHSVNAPAIANKALAAAHANRGTTVEYAKTLIQELGNSSYGRWDDDLPTGRYQRCRLAARASGLWPRALFDGPSALMPKDLPG